MSGSVILDRAGQSRRPFDVCTRPKATSFWCLREMGRRANCGQPQDRALLAIDLADWERRGSLDSECGFPTDRHRSERHRRSTEVLIRIVPEIVWNRASDSSPHCIPKKFRCGHWTKSYCTVDDESVVIFFDNIEAFQLVTLNFSLPSQ